MIDDGQKAAAVDLDAYVALAREAGALADAATAGPWATTPDGSLVMEEDENGTDLLHALPPVRGGTHQFAEAKRNGQFAAHARTSVPAMRDAILAMAEEMRRHRALVAALPKCEECGGPATMADHGPDGPTWYTCDGCAPAVRATWERHRVEAERESGFPCEPLVKLADVRYASELRAVLPSTQEPKKEQP